MEHFRPFLAFSKSSKKEAFCLPKIQNSFTFMPLLTLLSYYYVIGTPYKNRQLVFHLVD